MGDYDKPVRPAPAGLTAFARIESLEPRLLMYSYLGGEWPQPGGNGRPFTINYCYTNLFDGGIDFGSMSNRTVLLAIEEAMELWAKYSPITFNEVGSDQGVSWGHDSYDGSILGMGWSPTAGDIRFDDSNRTWTLRLFLEVAVHELGHGLGLGHSTTVSSPVDHSGGSGTPIMNPYVNSRYSALGSSYLYQDDVDGIRSRYGSGVGEVISTRRWEDGADGNWNTEPAWTRDFKPTKNSNTYIGSGRTVSVSSDAQDARTLTLGNGGAGTLRLTGGSLRVRQDINVGDDSDGTLQIAGATVTASDLDFGGNGASDTATVLLTSGRLEVSNSISDGSGRSVLNIAGGTLDVNGNAVTVDRYYQSGGNLVDASARLTVKELLQLDSVTLTFANLTVSGSVEVPVAATAAATISGAVNLGSGIRTFTVADVNAAGADLTVTGQMTSGGLTKRGAGTLRLAGGNYTDATTVQQGELAVAGSIGGSQTTVAAGATLSGGGTVGRTTNNGIVSPGDGAAGRLTINGNYSQSVSGRLVVELGGPVAATGYDVLNVGGEATLAGTLDVRNINAFAPAADQTFDVLRASKITLSNLTLTGAGNLFPTIVQSGSQQVLRLTPLVAIDQQAAGPEDAPISGQLASSGAVGQTTYTLASAPEHGDVAVAPDGSYTYTPHADYYGEDSFTFQVADSHLQSPPATVRLSISPLNDAPVFTGGADQAVIINAGLRTVTGWAADISPGPANEATQNVWFRVTADNPLLFAAAPAISPTGTLTFTPAIGAIGQTTVRVVLRDSGGEGSGHVNSSPEQTFVVRILPYAADLSVSGVEDRTIGGTVLGTGGNTQPTFSPLAGPAHGSVAMQADGAFVYTPAADFFGSDEFTFVARANGQDSAPARVRITLQGINDAPRFTLGAAVQADEDGGASALAGWATGVVAGPANEAGQALAFTLTTNNPALFSAGPALAADGTLTFTPAPDAFGTATVTAVLADNGGRWGRGVDTSAPQTFTITVRPQFDPLALTDRQVTMAEDAVLTDQLDAVNLDRLALTWSVVTPPQHGVLDLQPDGRYTYRPAANYNGSDAFVVHADNGRPDSGDARVDITVRPANDAPTFRTLGAETIGVNRGPRVVPGWAFDLSPGPADEQGQALAFDVTTTNPGLFLVPPSISPDGTLRYTVRPELQGRATVQVVLRDDGGQADGGDATSDPVTFEICLLREVPLDRYGRATYIDGTGDVINVALSGGGTGRLYFPPRPNTDVALIALTGTTESTVLYVWNQGLTTLGGLISDGPLYYVLAAQADLAGPATIGPSAKPWASVALVFNALRDASITSGVPVSLLQARQWLDPAGDDDALRAPYAGSIVISGAFQADLVLSGADAWGRSLAWLYVTGQVSNSRVRASASIGAAVVGSARDSLFLAGMRDGLAGLPTLAGDFARAASIGSFVILPGGSFENSVVAAHSLGVVYLRDVRGSGPAFGLAARTRIAAYARFDANGALHRRGQTYEYFPNLTQSLAPDGAFRVNIIQ